MTYASLAVIASDQDARQWAFELLCNSPYHNALGTDRQIEAAEKIARWVIYGPRDEGAAE